jgi:hypothetical protein
MRGSSPKLKKRRTSPQVFLSYANQDKLVAHQISDALLLHGVRVWDAEFEVKPGDSISNRIEEAISASDFLVVLLSTHSAKSHWVHAELGAAQTLQVMTARDITILPVLIEDCPVPASLSNLMFLDLRSNREAGIHRLIDRVAVAPQIDFSSLTANQFENLVKDLLLALGFSDMSESKQATDAGFDFLAWFKKVDPFGTETRERWMVTVKLYRASRPDLRSLLELTERVAKVNSNLLLVTNGQLTSTAANWLQSREIQNLRVLAGAELKRLLIEHPKLIRRYFEAGNR